MDDQNQAATGMSIDTPEFRKLLNTWYRGKSGSSRPLKVEADFSAIIAHIDAHTATTRAQLAAKGQGEPVGYVREDAKNGVWVELEESAIDMLPEGAAVYALAAPASAQPDRGAEQGNDLSPLDYRAQGREEALAIILAEDPENPFADHTNSVFGGEDYSTEWDEAALRELLHIGDRKHDAYDRAEAAYWDALGHKEEAEREMLLVKQAPFYQPLSDFLSRHKAWDLMGDLKRAAPHSQPVRGVPDGPIDANELERVAKAHPDECFLKGNGVLKLIGAIRTLEQSASQATARPAEESELAKHLRAAQQEGDE